MPLFSPAPPPGGFAARNISQEFESMVPFYIALGLASIIGTAAVIAVSRRVRDHPSAIILIITVVDLMYTLKWVEAMQRGCAAHESELPLLLTGPNSLDILGRRGVFASIG